MPKKVILSADRTCDLNEALVKRYHVNYMHGGLMLDNKNYTDCVDIFPSGFI